jgi:HEAT repeat protein
LSTPFQSVARKRRLYCVGAVLACITVTVLVASRVDSHYREVKQLVARLGPVLPYNYEPAASSIRALARLGPKAYPALAKLLLARDTKLDLGYDQCRASLPPAIRRFLPERQSKRDSSGGAEDAVNELGPSVSRAMVGAICARIRRTDLDSIAQGDVSLVLENAGLLGSLRWSIPESPTTLAALGDWLSKLDPDRMLWGMKDADEIWAQVPQFTPLLAQRLGLSNQAYAAARGLGFMGSNAVFAIPGLIDTFHNGVMGRNPETNSLGQKWCVDPSMLILNRIEAVGALGNLGVPSPEVLATLEQAFTHSNAAVRSVAANAIGKLGSKALPLLPTLLNKLDITNQSVLVYQIEAIGEMGPGAGEAIPVLRYWCDTNAVASLAAPESFSSVVHRVDDPLPLPGGAAVALLRVAPEQAKGFGERIAQALTPAPDSYERPHSVGKLLRLRPLADEIVPALKPALHSSGQWARQLTAFEILCLQPEHVEARKLLLDAMELADPPTLRARAAVYFWQATGDTNRVLAAFREMLVSVKDQQSQPPPVDYVGELGPVARPLVPLIARFLNGDDVALRQLAGKALRRIDPSALPPINEGYP